MSAAMPERLDWRRVALLSLLPFSALITLVRELKLYGFGFLEVEILALAAVIAILAVTLSAAAMAGPPVLRRMLVAGVVLHLILIEQVTSQDILGLHQLPLYGRMLIFLAVILGVGGVVWLLKANAPLVAATVLGTTLVGLVAETALLPESRAASLLTSTHGAVPTKAGGGSSVELPPVIHVVLDAHIGIAGLPPDIPGAAAAATELRSLYLGKGFAVFPHAYSRFAESQFAIPAMMNAAGPEQLFELVDPRLEAPFGFRVLKSRWLERLKRAGYRLTVYQNLWVDYCSGMPQLIDRCYTYPAFGPAGLRDTRVPRLKRFEILARYWANRFLPWGLVEVPPVSPLNSLRAFERLLDDLADGPDGRAYLVHLLVPHDGFILDEQCRPVGGLGAWREDHTQGSVYNTESERHSRYIAYLRQVHCAANLMRRLIETLERQGAFERATIIIHGDHGSRLARVNYKDIDPAGLSDRDVLDHFSTLYAIRMPGMAAGSHEEPASIQDLFARHLLGEERAASAAEVYVRRSSSWGEPPVTIPLPPS